MLSRKTNTWNKEGTYLQVEGTSTTAQICKSCHPSEITLCMYSSCFCTSSAGKFLLKFFSITGCLSSKTKIESSEKPIPSRDAARLTLKNKCKAKFGIHEQVKIQPDVASLHQS